MLRNSDEANKYGVTVKNTESGATLIDAGIKAKGGYFAGLRIKKEARVYSGNSYFHVFSRIIEF